jgi:hypothetical protein
MSSDLAAAHAALRAWILTKATTLDEQTLTDQTPLFTARHLRSVHLPELILLLERLTGSPIDVENLTAGDLRDIETMLGKFAAQATSPAAEAAR